MKLWSDMTGSERIAELVDIAVDAAVDSVPSEVRKAVACNDERDRLIPAIEDKIRSAPRVYEIARKAILVALKSRRI